jgi:hypothetical protein
MASAADHEDGATPRRSRRQLLTGGAAGAAGAFGVAALGVLASASPAEAQTGVAKVAAGDASVKVTGTIADPKIETGTLDKIASLHPPVAAVTFNGHKGTHVADGSAATDIAAFGQLPSSSSPLPLAEGGTGFSQSSSAALLASLGALPEAGGALTGALAPTVVALHPSGGRVTLNASRGNVFTLSLTASGWTIAAPTAPAGDGQLIRIRFTQDATGGRTVSWGTGFNWGSTHGTPNGVPTLSTTPHATDILGFEYIAASSTWCYLCAPLPQGF